MVNALADVVKVCRAKGALSVSPFDKPKKDSIAVKVINHLGDEVKKVFRG